MKNLYDIIRRPIVTEKTTALEGASKYVFEVAMGANKFQVRDAVEKLFSVDVRSVNTAIMQGKRKRTGRVLGKRSNWKKAVVTLKEGQSIELLDEGLLEDEETGAEA